MTSDQPASRFREGSIIGIAASAGSAAVVGYVCTFFGVSTIVQSPVIAGAAGLPAAIEYSLQSRRRDKTEDAARIAQGELRRPIGLVMAMLATALFLNLWISNVMPRPILENMPFGVRMWAWIFVAVAIGFVMVSYASHYLGEHPYRRTAATVGVVVFFFGSVMTVATWARGIGWEMGLFVSVVSLLPFFGVCMGGAWYGRRHQAEFLAKKLARMQRRASRVAATQQPPKASASDLLEQLKKLGELRDTGVLTEDEFKAKKAEILARI